MKTKKNIVNTPMDNFMFNRNMAFHELGIVGEGKPHDLQSCLKTLERLSSAIKELIDTGETKCPPYNPQISRKMINSIFYLDCGNG
jgi:hypothetical protein